MPRRLSRLISRIEIEPVGGWIDVGGHEAIAWTYAEPKPDVAEIRGLVAFYDERVQVGLSSAPIRQRASSDIE